MIRKLSSSTNFHRFNSGYPANPQDPWVLLFYPFPIHCKSRDNTHYRFLLFYQVRLINPWISQLQAWLYPRNQIALVSGFLSALISPWLSQLHLQTIGIGLALLALCSSLVAVLTNRGKFNIKNIFFPPILALYGYVLGLGFLYQIAYDGVRRERGNSGVKPGDLSKLTSFSLKSAKSRVRLLVSNWRKTF